MECELCEELYDESEHRPWILTPCGHCYCQDCLNKLINQSCPKCRGLVLSKTLNRGLLDVISSKSNTQRPTTARDSKIFQSLEKVFSELDNEKVALKLSRDEMIKESGEVVRKLQEQIQEETNRKMNILLQDAQSLLGQLDLLAGEHVREVNECVLFHNVDKEINEFEKNFASFNSLTELTEKHNDIKNMLNKRSRILIYLLFIYLVILRKIT